MSRDVPDTSVAAFTKFTMNAQDPNYTFMADIAFEIIDSVFMYRASVRLNITLFIKAARAKYAKVWCGRNVSDTDHHISPQRA